MCNYQRNVDKPCWDEIYLNRLEQASDPAKNSDIAAIVLVNIL